MENDRFYELSIRALVEAGPGSHKFPADYVKAALDTARGSSGYQRAARIRGFYFTDPNRVRR